MYGMPQPNAYGQYGFGAYAGFPNQAAAAGTPGAAAPGMPSPVAPTAAMGMGAGQTPVDASAQAAQGQWGSADPSSYYSDYWGGKPLSSMPCYMRVLLTTILRLLWPAGTRSGCTRCPGPGLTHFIE